MAFDHTPESPIMAVLVTPATRAEAAQEAQETAATLAQLRDWPCATAQDERDLADFLTALKDKMKDLDGKRTAITGPLNQAKRAVDALFKPALDAMAEAEAIIKGKLADAATRRNQLAQAALAQASRAAQVGDTRGAATALATASQAQEAAPPPGVTYRYTWDAQLGDIDQVPREWLSVDWSKVRLYTVHHQASETIPPVPGLVFTRKPIVVVAR